MAQAILAAMHDVLGRSRHEQATRFGNAVALLGRAFKGLFDPYRPELHYMRGPGPKWRAKYGNGRPLGR